MANLLRRFPLQVALGALLFYGLTLSHGATVNSLSLTSKIAGWDWLPMSSQPLLWLLTLPLRLLPSGWVAVGLNLFSAVCAATTLGLLARSLELLPWFNPSAMLKGWCGQLPFLLAIAAGGLEFNFWQEATAATGEMLDVLLLAAAVWCALEYGEVKNFCWLQAAALIWGLGLAENWMMLLTLPLFIVALVCLLKQRLFQRSAILSLAVLGLAGFSVYVLLPLANGLLPGSPWSLETAWLHSLSETKHLWQGIYGQFWVMHRMVAVAVLVYFLLPVVACLVRLPDEATENKSPLDQFQIWIFRGLRLGLFLTCVWLALDPANGPRGIIAKQFGFSLPLLSFDYLNGLAIGFMSGMLLSVRLNDASQRGRGFSHALTCWWTRLSIPLACSLLVIIAAGLVARNAPVITSANRQPLTQFGEFARRSLPDGGGIIVSDSPEKLAVFQAAQAGRANRSRWLPVDIKAFPTPEYRAWLERMSPGILLTPTNQHELAADEMLQWLSRLAQTNRVYYLHPSFGYFFEVFYQQPAGSVFELKRFQDEAINPPQLPSAILTQNEIFWDELVSVNATRQASPGANKISPVCAVEKFLHLTPVASRQSQLLGEWYSMGLNSWGVQLQRNGLLPAAQRRFNQALLLNSNNWVARINLYCNTNLQAGNTMSLAGMGSLASQLSTLQNLGLFMSHLGPLDEPASCYLLGNAYQQGGLPRLAIQQFDRARALAPDVLAPELALADIYVRYRLTDRAMTAISHLRGEIKKLPANASLEVQLSLLEASVWLSQTNLTRAASVLQSVVQQYPDDAQVLNQISEAYFSSGNFTNAEQLISHLLTREPDNIPALLMESGIRLQTRHADLALPVLNHVLALTNSPHAKFIRAIAYVQTTNYPAATADYMELANTLPNPFLAQYGLSQLAELQQDTNQAIHYLKLCLSNAPPESVQWREIHAHLLALKSN